MFSSYFPIGWCILTLQTNEKIEPPYADGDEEKGDLEKENRTFDELVPSQNAAMSACLRTFQAAQAELSQLINLINISRGGDQFVSVERVTKTSPLNVSNNGSILLLLLDASFNTVPYIVLVCIHQTSSVAIKELAQQRSRHLVRAANLLRRRTQHLRAVRSYIYQNLVGSSHYSTYNE